MRVHVSFYSYFKDLTGTAQVTLEIREGATLGELYQQLIACHPKLASMEKSTLMAVGVEYQPRNHVLKAGDTVSLFPPVQGG